MPIPSLVLRPLLLVGAPPHPYVPLIPTRRVARQPAPNGARTSEDREDLRLAVGNANRVLEMCRRAPIPRDDGPAIWQLLGFVRPQVRHRLNRERHARAQERPF